MDNLDNSNRAENDSTNEKEENLNPSIKEFKPSNEIVKGEDGWLSPSGVFYSCGTTEHDEAAKFLLSPKSPEHAYVAQEKKYDYWPNDPDRAKLSKIGYVLVRGAVVAPDTFANLTTAQLETLKRADILIIDPIDNSQCSPEFVIETANNLRDTAKAILETESYKEMLKHVERIFEETGITRKHLNTKFIRSYNFTNIYNEKIIRKYNNMTWQEREEYDAKGPFPNYNAFESVANIEDFIKTPFKSSITVTDNEKLTETVFEILSSGYTEGIRIKSRRHEWCYREIPTPDPNIFLTVSRIYYHHDGLSGGMLGTVNEDVSVRIQTKYQIEKELSQTIKRLITSPDENKNLPKVTTEGKQELYKL